MHAGPIRLLVVDDSHFVRTALRKLLEPATDIVVCAEAANGAEALRLCRKLKPHVIALDLDMPVMDGLEAVQAIAREDGPPCIMVSSDTSAGAAATLRALEAGAVDFVCKAASFVEPEREGSIARQLTEKIRHWGERRRSGPAQPTAHEPTAPSTDTVPSPCTARPTAGATVRAAVELRQPPDLVVIGVSTGGPVALAELLAELNPAPCPIAVAQHMPASFTPGFAASLARHLGRPVTEGGAGSVLAAGTVTVLAGGMDHRVRRSGDGRLVLEAVADSTEPYHPSATLLLHSAAVTAERPVGVILTGMGDDGSAGAAVLAGRGLPVLVQDPATCAVDGMPRAAIRAGAASHVLSIAGIARRLNSWFTL